MSFTNIKIDKTTGQVDLKADGRVITEEMTEGMTEICNFLLNNNDTFDAETAFNIIFQYIRDYHRILYSQISNVIYTYFNEHPAGKIDNSLGTMTSNIDRIVAYTGTEEYLARKRNIEDPEDIDALKDTEKVLIKMWDHVNLALTQYSGLKQTDEEYRAKFNSSIAPFKEELEKGMSAQLLTMVSIFTALAFLVFGGIDSLGNIFTNHELPMLKLVIIGCIWGLCILNLIFIFLFCVGKMTRLNFKSDQRPNANIIQKYPIVWWSNLIISTIMAGAMWAYYIRKENIDSWFIEACLSSPRLAMWLGFIVIAVVFIVLLIILVKQTWKKGD